MNSIIIKFWFTLRRMTSVLYFKWKGWPVKPNYKIISLGMGQQSVTLYLMSCLGELERADFAIFADTGAESEETYKYLKWLKQWAKRNGGIPIIHRRSRSLYKDLFKNRRDRHTRFASIPAFVRNLKGGIGMLKRQCTDQYKTREIYKVVRWLYGLVPKRRMPHTEMWLGISLEEKERVSLPRYRWLVHVYPFVNIRAGKDGATLFTYTGLLRRCDCTSWLRAHGFPVPPKSACVFCPFQSDARWREMKRKPKVWNKLVRLDEHIRNHTNARMKGSVFLHSSGIPLKDAELKESQLELFSCSSGMCGI